MFHDFQHALSLHRLLSSPSLLVLTLVVIIVFHYLLVSLGNRRNQQTANVIKPYSRFGHPHAFFVDKLLSFIIFNVFQLTRIMLFGNSLQNLIRYQRLILLKLEILFHHLACCALSKSCKDTLIGGTVRVPRNSNILFEWGITQSIDNSIGRDHDFCRDNDHKVDIEITCPSSALDGQVGLLGENIDTSNPKRNGGYKRSLDCDLKDLSLLPSVPILVWFHSGAMCYGSARDMGISVQLLKNLMGFEKKKTDDYFTLKPIVLLSVEYRLSPEHPFPAAVIDCLSAVSFIFETFPKASVHFGGLSAGGNLSAVTSFECLRRYPGRLKSATILDPYLLPEANTPSYYLNSNSSIVGPQLLRLCWRAYLSLDLYAEHNSTHNYISKAFKEKSRLYRLCCPQIDLPPNLNYLGEGPLFLVHTATADILRDDGLNLLKCVGGESLPKNFVHFEGNGSHALALRFDIETRRKLMAEWYKAIWE